MRGRAGAAALAAAAIALPAGAETPPAAGGEACAAIARAVHAVAEAEQFHSRLLARTPGRRRPAEQERFVIGDVVYTTSPAGGRWVKLPLTPEGRRGLEAGILAYPPQDCRDEGVQRLEGGAARLYSFRQVLPEGGAMAAGRLWVGEADGRPRRYEGGHGEVSILVTFDYEGITPPYGR